MDAATDDGRTALYNACCKGHAELVAELLAANATVDQADEDGRTPLIVACQPDWRPKSHKGVITVLLAAGADAQEAYAVVNALLIEADALITRDPSPFIARLLPEAQVLVTSDHLMSTTSRGDVELEEPQRAISSAGRPSSLAKYASTPAPCAVAACISTTRKRSVTEPPLDWLNDQRGSSSCPHSHEQRHVWYCVPAIVRLASQKLR